MRPIYVSILACTLVMLSGCNGGGSSQPEPSPTTTPLALPNVFDQSSVKDLQFNVMKIDNSEINNGIDLTKVAGHAYYKIKITNPNKFNLNITNVMFEHESSYLFVNNKESDNCFNQAWYISDGANTMLEMPANGSCSLYTISPWIKSYTTILSQVGEHSRLDFVNYTAIANGFGFSRLRYLRTNMWCESGCYPIGTMKELNASDDNTINLRYYTWPISRSIFKDVSPSSLIQNGDFVIEPYLDLGYIRMKKYPVSYDKNQHDLLPLQNVESFIAYNGTASALRSFSFNSDGSQGLIYAVLTQLERGRSILGLNIGYSSATGKYVAGAGDNDFFISGLNNVLYHENYSGAIGYLDNNNSLDDLNSLIPNIPIYGSLYGVDINNNFVIQPKNESNIYCYLKDINYGRIPALSNLSDIQTQPIISSKHLYSKNTNFAELFYNFNQKIMDNPFSYQVDTTICQTIPTMLAAESQIVITDKYAAVATDLGYFFVPSDEVYSE